jgi:hypothetical protein
MEVSRVETSEANFGVWIEVLKLKIRIGVICARLEPAKIMTSRTKLAVTRFSKAKTEWLTTRDNLRGHECLGLVAVEKIDCEILLTFPLKTQY